MSRQGFPQAGELFLSQGISHDVNESLICFQVLRYVPLHYLKIHFLSSRRPQARQLFCNISPQGFDRYNPLPAIHLLWSTRLHFF